MGSSVGMQWQGDRLVVARMGGSRRHPRLLGLVSRPLADGGLAGLVEEQQVPARGGVLAIPSEQVSIRPISLPLTGMDTIQRTLRFQAERFIPGITPEEIALDFFITHREKDYTALTLLVVKRKELAALLAPLREVGLEPRQATVDLVAVHNLLHAADAYAGAPCAAVIDFAGPVLHLLVVRQGRLVGMRKLAAGEAHRLPTRLVRELHFSLVAADVEGKADRVILTGTLPETLVVEAIGRTLDSPVTAFNPLDTILMQEGQELQGLIGEAPAALGAALEGLGRVDLPIDLLRKEQRYKGAYETLRTPILAALLLLITFIGVELLGTMQAAADTRAGLDRMKRFARGLYGRVVDPSGRKRKVKLPNLFHKQLATLARQRRSVDTDEAEWRSFLDFLKNLTGHLPLDDRTIIHTINFKGDKATIRGEADDVASFEAVTKALERSGRFEVRAPMRRRPGRVARQRKPLNFSIELAPRRK